MTADDTNGISEEESQETDSFVTNEINVPTATDTVSVNAEAGPSNYTANKQFKTPTNKQNKKRKAVDVIQGRMDEAYKILKTAVSEKPKTSQTSLYGQLVAQKLETLDELQRVIVMNEIDNVLFRATMRHMGAYSTNNTLQLQQYPSNANQRHLYNSSPSEHSSSPANSYTSLSQQSPDQFLSMYLSSNYQYQTQPSSATGTC